MSRVYSYRIGSGSSSPDAIMFDQITNRGLVIPEPSSLLLLGTASAEWQRDYGDTTIDEQD